MDFGVFQTIFEETMLSGMYPNIYVASFGTFYLCLGHQYMLKYWVQELTAVLGMALKFLSALCFKAMQKELNWEKKNKRYREES